MRSLVATLTFVVASAFGLDAASAAPPSDVGATIDRGLAFLVKDALAW